MIFLHILNLQLPSQKNSGKYPTSIIYEEYFPMEFFEIRLYTIENEFLIIFESIGLLKQSVLHMNCLHTYYSR